VGRKKEEEKKKTFTKEILQQSSLPQERGKEEQLKSS
jgi:hypothetical protein